MDLWAPFVPMAVEAGPKFGGGVMGPRGGFMG